MEATKFNWDTEFNTAYNLMIHTFSDRVKVVANLNTGETRTFRDGEEIDRRTNMPISDYERFLITIAKDADKLKGFVHCGRLK
jgi:hypothetical protein